MSDDFRYFIPEHDVRVLLDELQNRADDWVAVDESPTSEAAAVFLDLASEYLLLDSPDDPEWRDKAATEIRDYCDGTPEGLQPVFNELSAWPTAADAGVTSAYNKRVTVYTQRVCEYALGLAGLEDAEKSLHSWQQALAAMTMARHSSEDDEYFIVDMVSLVNALPRSSDIEGLTQGQAALWDVVLFMGVAYLVDEVGLEMSKSVIPSKSAMKLADREFASQENPAAFVASLVRAMPLLLDDHCICEPSWKELLLAAFFAQVLHRDYEDAMGEGELEMIWDLEDELDYEWITALDNWQDTLLACRAHAAGLPAGL